LAFALTPDKLKDYMHSGIRFAGLFLTFLSAGAFAQDSYIIEDGGVSLQLGYWLTRSSPDLRKGRLSPATAAQSADFDFPGNSKYGFDAMFSIPAGKEHSLRLSAFRVRGRGDGALSSKEQFLFTEVFAPNTLLTTNYRIEGAKLSWDYLSYTVPSSSLRIKTLWEVQYVGVHGEAVAPFTDNNLYDRGASHVILPTLGIGLGQAPSRRFRWEAKASGFGLPRRSYIWNAEAAAVIRLGKVDVLAGARAFSVKASPKESFYFKQTLTGPFVALRWNFQKP
jgi:hypothetical protein